MTLISCGTGKRVARDYLQEKADQASERCAIAASNPPYRGCLVDGYRCSDLVVAGRSRAPLQLCAEHRLKVMFKEIDADNG